MEVLKIMLQQRGVDVASPDTIEAEFPAEMTKFGKTVVYMVERNRVVEKDIAKAISITEENGGDMTILVMPVPPSATTLTFLRQVADKCQLFHLSQLQFDITTHRKVPAHRILNAEERTAFLEKFHIRDPDTQMPLIDSQDMMARWIGAKPGDIVEIIRKSETAGNTPYYRLCVSDVTL